MSYPSTSSTSLTVGLGTATLTIGTGLSYVPGNPVKITYTGNPTPSTTSLTIAMGAQTLTIGTGLPYTTGDYVQIEYSPTQYMYGNVTSYNATTGALAVEVNSVTGTGTYTSWTVTNIVGTTTMDGDTLSYNTTTGVLIFAVSDFEGSGTYNSWEVTSDLSSLYPITYGYNGLTATGGNAITTGAEDAFNPNLAPSPFPSSAGTSDLGQYSVALTSATQGSRSFVIDTSFEPYRREAFRHRSIPSQRESIQMTNIVGQGTVNTEGLWRREQVEWSMGAGQQYLDRKQDSQETRFLQSKGVDVFSFPLQATLLPDTVRRDSLGTVTDALLMARCNDYVVVADAGVVKYVLASTVTSQWGSFTTCTYDTTTYQVNTPTTITAPTVIHSIATNDTFVYIATDTGIWYCQIGLYSAFQLFASPDTSTGFTGGYDMVRWANDQLIASRNSRLFAFQPRDASSFPFLGSLPTISDVNENIATITYPGGTSTTATVTTSAPHNLVVNQPITINDNWTSANTTSSISIATGSGTASNIATVTTTTNHGLNVGETFSICSTTGTVNVTASVATVTSNTVFTFTTTASAISGGIVVSGVPVNGANTTTGSNGFNASYVVGTVPSATTFTITVPTSSAYKGTGGTLISSTLPDMLYTHENPQWIWSDVAGGETQVYLGGYVKSASGKKYGGCIYRSDLLGSSTTSATGVSTITTSSLVEPFALNTPVQALPMSPDEYPVCVQSYLNYIFVGTNRGIRMCETLSIYDPTATATGDLKSGPLIPNILQPVTVPVTAIVGDGRYVWFAWNNYDDQSTGLGKLDLTTFIAGDPLTPAYASDIMVTGQGIINSLDWDPFEGVPLMAIGGVGIYAPYATNIGGNTSVYKYVPSGYIDSGYFTYGIPDPKIPVSFDYGAIAPKSSGTSVQAFVNIDPLDADAAGFQVLPSYPQAGDTSQSEFPVPYYHAEQFGVRCVLYSDTVSHGNTPILHRWTLKSWPATVQGTEISVVVQLFSVNVVDGQEVFVDPYDNFIWLENLRQAQEIIQYQEGPLVVRGVIDSLDWIPHKRRDNYENGFEGDCVVSIKTVMPYSYVPAPTL